MSKVVRSPAVPVQTLRIQPVVVEGVRCCGLELEYTVGVPPADRRVRESCAHVVCPRCDRLHIKL